MWVSPTYLNHYSKGLHQQEIGVRSQSQVLAAGTLILWDTCVLTAHWDFCIEKLTLNKHEEICEHFLWYFIDTSSWLFPIFFHKPRTGSFILPLLWLLGSAWCGWEEWIHNYYINALFFTMNTEMHFKIHRDSPVVSAVMLPSSSLTLLGEESMLISLVLSLFTMFSG